jgi:CPA2 family monovalent cation:H+ antiporter-2
MDAAILSALGPILVLLALAVVAGVASRIAKISAIVGYLVLGVILNAADLRLVTSAQAVAALANLGVMFLLFELGLHFPLAQIRQRAGDIFGFGPVQIVLGAIGLGPVVYPLGAPPVGAALLGAALALSSRVLREMGVTEDRIAEWRARIGAVGLAAPEELLEVA